MVDLCLGATIGRTQRHLGWLDCRYDGRKIINDPKAIPNVSGSVYVR
jgi:hypothetical protein